MKKISVIRRTILIGLLLTAISCKKDDDPEMDPVKHVTIQLSGANEVPAISTTGSGTAQISYNQSTRRITYILTWQLGSASATTTLMHFHGAEDGSDTKSSPPVIDITGFTSASSGTLTGTTRELTGTESAQLLAGKWYVNIHSSTYPAGEIRGNIKFP